MFPHNGDGFEAASSSQSVYLHCQQKYQSHEAPRLLSLPLQIQDIISQDDQPGFNGTARLMGIHLSTLKYCNTSIVVFLAIDCFAVSLNGILSNIVYNITVNKGRSVRTWSFTL